MFQLPGVEIRCLEEAIAWTFVGILSEKGILFDHVNKNYKSKHFETLGKFINKLSKMYYKMVIKIQLYPSTHLYYIVP